MERESFVFHRSYAADVPKKIRPFFYEFIVDYGIDGKEPDFSGKPEDERWLWVKIWNSIKERINADFESYLTTTEKRKLSYAQNHWKQGRATKEEIDLLKSNKFDFSSGTFGNATVPVKNFGNATTDTDTRRVFVSESVPESVSDTVSEFESVSDCVSVSEKTSHTPTLEEISDYVDSNNLGIDAERFFDTYEQSSWKINGKPFDWRKRADYWARTQTVKVRSGNDSAVDGVPAEYALTAENAARRRRKNE